MSVVLSASVVVVVDAIEEPAGNEEEDVVGGVEDGALLAMVEELAGVSRKQIEYLRRILRHS